MRLLGRLPHARVDGTHHGHLEQRREACRSQAPGQWFGQPVPHCLQTAEVTDYFDSKTLGWMDG